MSVIRLTCSSCDARLKVNAEPGKSVKCPRCGKGIRVPEPEEELEVIDEEEEPAPKKRSPGITSKAGKAPLPGKSKRSRDEDEDSEEEEPAPRKRRDAITSKTRKSAPVRGSNRPRDEDDEEDEDEVRPRKRGKKEKKGSPVLLWVGLGGGGLALVAGIILAIILFWPQKTPESVVDEKQPPPTPKVESTPQDAFDAYVAAQKRRDIKGILECYSPQGRANAVRSGAYISLLTRAKSPTIAAVLDKHGLTVAATKHLLPTLATLQNPTALEKNADDLIALVKDQDALLVDLITAQLKQVADRDLESASLTLTDLKTTGDTASGEVTTVIGGLTLKEPITFPKINGTWKITPARELKALFSGGQGQ